MITRVSGIGNAGRNLRRLLSRMESVRTPVLVEIGQHLQAEAKILAPKDKGDLRSSSYVEEEDGVVWVGFTEKYALRMHEDMTYKAQEPGTGPKYLTKALYANERKYMQRIFNTHRVR